jgi:hypothetical protein
VPNLVKRGSFPSLPLFFLSLQLMAGATGVIWDREITLKMKAMHSKNEADT